jgi:hypothetical protein
MVIYCGKDYEGIGFTNDKKCKKKQLSPFSASQK